MPRLCWFLLFSVVVVHGTNGRACTGDLDSINPAHWSVLRKFGSRLPNARIVTVDIQCNRYPFTYQQHAVVHTRNRRTYLYGSPTLYGTASNNRVRELREIRGRDIKDIQFGFQFMAVLDYGGKVWTVGYNYHGEMARGSSTALGRVTLPGTVKEIAVGWHHCVVLTTGGQLFSWGFYSSSTPPLGYVSSITSNPTPRSFTLGTGVSRPDKICCGGYACAVLTQHSGVYSWGYHTDIGRTGDHRIPGRVMGIPPGQAIVKLSCGLYHTVAVSSTGNMYGWGQNGYGELLQAPSGETHATILGVRVSDAVAGYYLTIVRYESGTSEYFGRYSGSDIHIARSTSSQSPRDLMARSWVWGATRPATKGVVRLCG